MDNLDHRRLGADLDLFHIEPGHAGFVYWHPKGWHISLKIQDLIRRKMKEKKYKEVRTPSLLPRENWEKSGHWEKFGANMYPVSSPDGDLALKPMSCPGHVAIFNARPRSWRELPWRVCEFGQCHRMEASGAVLGLMRARAFDQDDAHVICKEDQVEGEISNFISLLKDIYGAFGFEDIDVALSLRPDKRVGDDAQWDASENQLLNAARANGLEPKLLPGEGAFYGPKLEFGLKDRQGKIWQCGTVQLDYVLPKRLGAHYKGDDNLDHSPVMIHHAVLGSLERFIGMLLEHHNGCLPPWLSPDPVAILPIAQDHNEAAWKVKEALEEAGIEAHVKEPNETLSKRIVMSKAEKIPLLVILGQKEIEAGRITIKDAQGQESFALEEGIEKIRALCQR